MVTLQSLPCTTRDGTSRKTISAHRGWSPTHANGSTPPTIKKRGQKGSNSRANSNRIAKTKLTDNIKGVNSGREEPEEGGNKNRGAKNNNKLSFEDTMEIMARRRNPESDITNKELDEIENAAEDEKKSSYKS